MEYHGGGDTSRRLKENKVFWHTQPAGMEVAKCEATWKDLSDKCD